MKIDLYFRTYNYVILFEEKQYAVEELVFEDDGKKEYKLLNEKGTDITNTTQGEYIIDQFKKEC
jgi:hypothetical protein